MKKRFVAFVNRRFVHTAGAAGDFDESVHQEFLLKAEEVWKEGKFEDDLIPQCDALITHLGKQTARFKELDDPDHDNDVKVTWIKACGQDVSDFVRADDTCEIEGDELETASKEYSYDRLKKTGFSVDDEKLRTNTYTREEIVAKGMMRCDKQLSEWYTTQFMTFLSASAGDNIAAIKGLVNPFTWNAPDSTTEIPDANYNTSMVALLIKQKIINLVKSGYYLEDGTLFVDWTNAEFDKDNADGDGKSKRAKAVDMNFDLFNFLAAGVTENMFLLDRNAVAVKSYTRYNEMEILGGQVNQTRYRFKSNILPGFYYDVIYVMKCVGGKIKHTWQFMTEGGMWLNPEPCPITYGGDEYTPNGVWGFTKGA